MGVWFRMGRKKENQEENLLLGSGGVCGVEAGRAKNLKTGSLDPTSY